jgi:hypothetical protein
MRFLAYLARAVLLVVHLLKQSTDDGDQRRTKDFKNCAHPQSNLQLPHRPPRARRGSQRFAKGDCLLVVPSQSVSAVFSFDELLCNVVVRVARVCACLCEISFVSRRRRSRRPFVLPRSDATSRSSRCCARVFVFVLVGAVVSCASAVDARKLLPTLSDFCVRRRAVARAACLTLAFLRRS